MRGQNRGRRDEDDDGIGKGGEARVRALPSGHLQPVVGAAAAIEEEGKYEPMGAVDRGYCPRDQTGGAVPVVRRQAPSDQVEAKWWSVRGEDRRGAGGRMSLSRPCCCRWW